MVSPAIQDLRLFQFGKEIREVQASQTLSIPTHVTAGDTFTIDGTLYTFVGSGAVAGQVNVGSNAAGDQANIVAAINGTDNINTPHPTVYISPFTTGVATIRADTPGAAGNSIATTETFAAGGNVFGGATLANGLDYNGPVAATSKMLVADWDAEPIDTVYHPPLLRGLIQRNKGGEIVTERGTNFAIPTTPALYEQLPNWFSMSVKGGVIASSLGGGLYSYTFTRDPTGNPLIDLWTFERRNTDGSAFLDYHAAYGFLEEWTLSGSRQTPVTFEAKGAARRLKASPLTASLSAPSNPETLLSSSSKVYINDTWGALGNTQILGQIVDWKVTFHSGYMPFMTTDGRSDRDFTVATLSSDNTQIETTITMLVKPGGGQFVIENAAAENQTLRAIRIQTDGQLSNGKQLQLDMLVKHNLGSLFKIGVLEGQDIIQMSFVESTDGTNLFRAKVINGVSTMV